MKTKFKKLALPILSMIAISGFAMQSTSALASTEKTHIVTNEKNNIRLISDYLNALFVERDLKKVETFWGKDMIQHNPNMPNGLDVLRGIIGKIGPEFKYEQGLITSHGSFVMVQGRYVGWGPKPMVAVDIFKIKDNKVVEHWDVMQEEVPADKSANGHAMFPAK